MSPKKMNRIALTLYTCNWIFGLGIIQYPLGNRHPKFSLAYSSMWIVSYCSVSALAYPHMMKWSLIMTNTLGLVKILFCSNIVLTISVIVLAWFRSEVTFGSVKKCMMVNDLMERIGINTNIKRMRKAYMGKLIKSAMLVATVITVNTVLISLEESPLHAKIAAGISLCYPMVIMLIADMTFLMSVSIISRKYEILNKILRRMLTDKADLPRHKRLTNQLTSEEHKLPIETIDCAVNDPANVIKVTKQIHLQLVKLSETVNDTYGLQILLSIVVAFGVITGSIYVSYMLILDGNIRRNVVIKGIINATIWTSYYVFKISNFTRACSRCKQNAITTGDLLNKFYDDPLANDEVQSEIRNFNLQLIQRPVNFTAAGYIIIDERLIQIMASSITTYLMILVEIGKSST